jgi:signal transduction histidine kinase/ActR/RegA family two-component response regulator
MADRSDDKPVAALEQLAEQLSLTQQTLAEERQRRRGAEALADELRKLASAPGRAELGERCVEAARRLFEADGAALLRGQGDTLSAVASTCEAWADLRWSRDDFVVRLLEQGVVLIARPDLHDSWQRLLRRGGPFTARRWGNALLIGLPITDVEELLLVCVGQRRGAFRHEQRQRGELLREPLLEAWRRVLANEHQAALRVETEAANRALRVARDELVAARDQAESASRAKSVFLAQMSHELRTPLGAIIGLTELTLAALPELEEPPQPQPTASGGETPRELIDLARQSAEHLLAVLNSMLDLSKIEAGKLTLERVPLDLEALARESVELTMIRARGKQLELAVELELQDTPRLRVGDPLRLKQVLLNLLSNAVKFTPRGRVALRLSVGRGDEILFEVADTGIGIPAARLSTIFDAFRQVDESTARRFGGTGLGLTICRRLVALFGGELRVESEVNLGSRFYFALSLPPAQQPGRRTGPLPLPNCELAWDRPQVLLVEDNRVNQLVGQRLLEGQGFEVTVANDGRDALQLLEGDLEVDLVLMDIQMPELDGLQTTAALRALPARRSLPVIALTANAMRGEAERCRAAGMDGYLTKPLRMGALREELDRLNLHIAQEQ